MVFVKQKFGLGFPEADSLITVDTYIKLLRRNPTSFVSTDPASSFEDVQLSATRLDETRNNDENTSASTTPTIIDIYEP